MPDQNKQGIGIVRKSKLFVFLIGLVLLSLAGVSMALFEKMVLFSEVSGVVTNHGQPVAGAEVERVYNWGWKDVTKKERTTTDGEGRFAFPEATGSTIAGSILPHEPVITQSILIRHEGVEFEAWDYEKHNYTRNGELGGRALNLICELSTEPSFKDPYYGICTLAD